MRSTLSTPWVKFIDVDISDFYLNSIFSEPEWIRILFVRFPFNIIEHYQLTSKHNKEGLIMTKLIKEINGLPQVGIIAYIQLKPFLTQAGYVLVG